MLNEASKAAASSETVPPPSTGALAIGPHLHHSALRPGHRPAHEQQTLTRDHVDHGQPALGDPAAAHPAGSLETRKDARGRGRGTDRTGRADVVGAVGLRAALEVVPADRALEALALRGPGDLDLVSGAERLAGHRVADQQLARLITELPHHAMRRGRGLLQMTELGLGERLLLAPAEGQLDGLVAVALDRADRGDRARPGLEHGDTLDAAILEELLGHTELAREDGGHYEANRISMSTPAGRWSSRWSESTVFGAGWWISISRLCVRISKCSRESLSLNGERITQYTFFSVGRGTGPETVAPVRVAVSTISFAAVSIAVWS